jgi:hypothetical protein
MKILILLTLIPSTTYSSDWYCKTVASEWVESGKTLSACGVGYGDNENDARLNAFENAKKEFNSVCSKETSCAGRVVNIDPQRGDCNKENDKFTCHRLFHFYITDEFRTPEETPIVVAPGPTIIKEKTEINNIHNSYTIINQPVKIMKRDKASEGNYATLVRTAGGVRVYETNHRGNQGVYLTNPSDSDIESAIKRGSRGGEMNRIYILRSN